MGVMPHLKQHEDRWQDAVATIYHRRLHDSPTKRRMQEVAERYNNSVVYALNDVEGEPSFPPLAGAIIADAIDSHSTRANSTSPILTAPATTTETEAARRRARNRRHAWAATWGENQLRLKLGRVYRQLYAYATFCISVYPDHDQKRPIIETRDPLMAYPEPMNSDEVRRPANIGFVYGQSPETLKRLYPSIADWVNKNTGSDDDLWDILDWYDPEWRYIGILGKRGNESFRRRYDAQGQYIMEADQPLNQALLLRAAPNRSGVVPAVCPQQVTLDRQMSAITRIIPIADVMNQVAAMQFISTEKAIWPHLFVLGEQGNEPELLSGQIVDGRTGEANLVRDVSDIKTLQVAPSPETHVLMSNLERSARLATGNPSLQQGEMSPSVRSGQTINQLAAASIDPRIEEAHIVMQYALKTINEIVAETQKGYWPDRKYTVFSEWPGSNRHVTYRPRKIWGETTLNAVTYPVPGMDAQGANIILQQLVEGRMLSRRSAREHHPLVSQMDPDDQNRQIMEEAVDDAISMAMLDQVSKGMLAFTDLGALRKKIRAGKMIEEAMEEVQAEAQERQATEAPPPEPGQVIAPEALPGINAPEAGGQAPPPASPTPAAPPSRGAQFNELAAALMASPGGQ